MAKFDLSKYVRYKNDKAVHYTYCDIGGKQCTATNEPSYVIGYFIIDKDNNKQQINVCSKCSGELTSLEFIEQ